MDSNDKRVDTIYYVESPEPTPRRVLLSPEARPRRRGSRTVGTVIFVLIGLLAGWIGGITLTGAFHQSGSAPNSGGNSNSIEPPNSQANPPSSSNASTASTPPSTRRRDPRPESEPPESEPEVSDSVNKDSVNKLKDDKATPEIPSAEDSAKEIGQRAQDKILKENEKMKRGKYSKANKNID
jgi:hypothetical protein